MAAMKGFGRKLESIAVNQLDTIVFGHLESLPVVLNQGFWYILVYTGMYLYVTVCTSTKII
jgi:hypothetical protein